MPCYYYDDREIAAIEQNRMQRVTHERNELTRMLCEVMTRIEDIEEQENVAWFSGTRPKIEGLDEWWSEHQRLDALRLEEERRIKEAKEAAREREQLVKQALEKLSDKEKAALGV
jgi:cell division protein ZapA (FtsZ GTPase activity inhibitor)